MIFYVEFGASLFCLDYAPRGLSVFIICNHDVPRLTAQVVYLIFLPILLKEGLAWGRSVYPCSASTPGHQQSFVSSLTGHDSSLVCAHNKKGGTKGFWQRYGEEWISSEYPQKKKIHDQFEKYQQTYNIDEWNTNNLDNCGSKLTK